MLVAVVALGTAAPSGEAGTSSLTIQTSLAHVGYVSATLSGPPGLRVQLSAQPAGTTQTKPLRTLTLGSAPLSLPRLVEWQCQLRDLTLVATALAPAPTARATASVRTPSCRRRLDARLPRSGLTGRALAVRVHDRWGLGSMPVSLCVAAPGAARTCRTYWLRSAQRQRAIKLPAPRVGGWRIELTTRYGQRWQRLAWVSHRNRRIRLLAAGDSEMQILDDFIAQDLAARHVDVSSDARISTGLTNSSFFNWQTHARAKTASLHQDLTVIFMGANDGFAVRAPDGRTAQCCGPAWSAGYATLVAEMIRTFLQNSHGRVYWFLLPEPRPANFQSVFHAVNAGIRQAAARFPGRVALIDADAFFTPGGRYRDYMSYHGHGFVIHETDGIHLSTASDHVAADLLVRQLIADRVIR